MTEPPDNPDEAPNPAHKRRPRYKGTHPRRFEERYKELEAEKYPDIVPHVLAKGRTPAGQHVPIMVEEVLEALRPVPGLRGVDATLGYGGHAQRLLDRLRPDGHLLGLDQDPLELPRTEARLRAAGYDESILTTKRTNFAGLHAAIAGQGWSEGADLILADLGVSSMQIDDPKRGFTFGDEGPLDMRMNPNRGLSAAAWLERASVKEISRALAENSDEPHADVIAAALDVRRGHLATTQELAAEIRRVLLPLGPGDEAERSVRRVFQALRIEVNDEFGALDALLRDLPWCLAPGGRVAIITFHSGEDRRVKKALQEAQRDGTYSDIARDVVRASAAERFDNPRSRPAKLRWARRAG
jgi:16S rRNA (cytosine1402-N4)-methyltransferase